MIKGNKHIKTITALVALAMSTVTANTAPGDLYEADYGSRTIYKFAPDGTQSPFIATGLNGPFGLAFDSAGNLFVADGYDGHAIYRFAPDGTQSTFATGLNPRGLAFDSGGNFFVETGVATRSTNLPPMAHRALSLLA